MNKLFFLVCLVILTFSCKNASENNEMSTEDQDLNISENIKGATFDTQNVLSYDQLLTQMEGQDSIVNVQVEGRVESVCQVKGCWMTIVSDTPARDTMFVKFKDYAFFMPLDLQGKVIMKGKAFREETPVDELRHYAEDNGESPEAIAAITEPLVELKFLAEGVKILD